ncbi:hypothetical protein B296_00003321 [Ensete ventricosum]|uniref:Uncharacterized protein n=1 Tax=Ensete ventricosum TaxID=4639 RepID=A0A427A636_ENSVE|nr:hypothetical protein B296_00003321 [Ensete ventricosum]
MRLYRVESFYTFLLYFCSEANEEKGRPATASPHARPATHGQVMGKALCKGAVGCIQGQPEREASGTRKGRQPPTMAEASPTGVVAPRRGRSAAHGGSSHPLAQPLVARRPQGWPPLGRAAASGQGQPSPAQGQRRRHRRGKRC